MTDLSSNLSLPFLLASQADKHVMVNESLAILDCLVQLTFGSAATDNAPAQPIIGKCYLVGAQPAGLWQGYPHHIATWQTNGWTFLQPQIGWNGIITTEKRKVIFDGAGWVDVNVRQSDRLSINAATDANNRLSLRGHSSLLSHEGSHHRLKINKANQTDVASLIFQSGFNGHAEMGLIGSNQFNLKVSANGQTFSSAMIVDAATQRLGLWTEAPEGPLHLVRASEHMIHERIDNTASACGTVFRKARGAIGTLGVVQLNDGLASEAITGFDGSTYLAGGLLRWAVDGPVATGTLPTRLELWTASSSQGLTERVRLTGEGNLGLGTTAPTTRLHVAGQIRTDPTSKTSLPAASAVGAGTIAYVSDDIGGPVLAFSDGSQWRRVTDRQVVS
ncbi:MAG: hypothetical protein CFE27_01755 [Alphaproteobacteria bacterium PA1]|nr:MAG: hypothetical protein CFE27_01755 [Alphaproteobacteria bacterium PA1]